MPEFTVIIPTYNRPTQLGECLESLFRLEFESDFEVIVVDDGSVLAYDSVRQRFPRVRFLRQPNSGPGEARNYAASRAEGRYLAFLDDDCLADPAWLTYLARGFEEFPEAILGGTTEAADLSNPFDTTSQLVQHIAYAYFNSDPRDAQFFASNNLAVSKSFFLQSEGFCSLFNRTASEDREWCNRASFLGRNLIWVKEARVFHKPGLSFSGYCRMFFRYGRGAALFHSRRQVGTFSKDSNFYLEFPFLLRDEFQRRPELPRMKTLGLLMMWQLCNAAGFFYQSAKGVR